MSKYTLQTKFRYDKIKKQNFIKNYGRMTVLKYLEESMAELQELRNREVEIINLSNQKIKELQNQVLQQTAAYEKLEGVAKDLALAYFLK
jgi:hypothetical protein